MPNYFDVITIGGATQDTFFISKNYSVYGDILHLAWGEKFIVDDLFTDVGGGAANSAVALSRLGLKTAFWGKVGMDISGQVIAQRLKQEKVSSKFLIVDDKAQTSTSAIMVGNSGERSIVMYRGPNDDLLAHTKNFEGIKETNWIYLSDLGANTEKLTTEVIKLVKKEKLSLAFVPGQHQLKLGLSSLKSILAVSKILILNIYESYTLLKGKFPGEDKSSCHFNDRDVKEMLREFSLLGPEKIVVTRDKCGVSCFDGVDFYESQAINTKNVVDTTGAGDAFASGFLAGIIKEKDIPTSLMWGNKNAGAVISFYGAQHGLLRSLD